MKASRQYLLVGLIMGLSSFTAYCQAQAKSLEPFERINRNQLVDSASPALLQRLNNIERLPTTKAVYLFRLNPSIVIGENFELFISNQITFKLSRTGGERSDSKDFTWLGEVRGEGRGTATLVAHNGEIMGSINSPLGLYRIAPLGEQAYALIQVDTHGFPKEEPSPKQ